MAIQKSKKKRRPILPSPNYVEIVPCSQCIHRGSKLEHEGKTMVACYLMPSDGFCCFGESTSGLKYTPKGTKSS